MTPVDPSLNTPETQPPAPFAALLSYLVPGLGQIVQGRVTKGLLFMVLLLGLFFLGQAMGDWKNVYIPREGPGPGLNGGGGRGNAIGALILRWHYGGQFWIGVAAWPAIWQFYDMPVPAAEEHPFWHSYQRGPRNPDEEKAVNTFLVNSDKTPDLGWVYTVIAGMLNVLVIYDAFAGPAYGHGRPAPRDDEGTGEVPA
jgi:hypothetical protein